jgi:hypothetical protein
VTVVPDTGLIALTRTTPPAAAPARRAFVLTYLDGPFSSVVGQFLSRRQAVATARGYGFRGRRFRNLTKRS